MKLKQCSKCKETKPLTNEYFPRNASRKSGFNPWCKICHRTAAKSNREVFLRKSRDAAKYRKNKNKVKARQETRAKFGTASDYNCSVLNCPRRAENFHHINYDHPLDIIPLCQEHHDLEHYKELVV